MIKKTIAASGRRGEPRPHDLQKHDDREHRARSNRSTTLGGGYHGRGGRPRQQRRHGNYSPQLFLGSRGGFAMLLVLADVQIRPA